MRLTNTTDIPNDVVREVLRFVMPPGLTNVRVAVQNRSHWHCGGHAEPGRPNRVLLRVAPQVVIFTAKRDGVVRYQRWMYPRKHQTYQYGQLKGKRYYIADRIECLVYLAAHELRHLWQGKARNKSGYAWGARGRYSEIDTESYAIRKLRAWRKAQR